MCKIIFSKESINSLRDADKYGSNLSNLLLHFLSKLNILWGGAEQTFSRIVYFANKGDLDDDDDGDDGGVDDDGDGDDDDGHDDDDGEDEDEDDEDDIM